ncbi:kinase-like domain-containing protein [Spinellus fusiger]|nr:kinase-like domain-containing protein [Spinellus fusiger]
MTPTDIPLNIHKRLYRYNEIQGNHNEIVTRQPTTHEHTLAKEYIAQCEGWDSDTSPGPICKHSMTMTVQTVEAPHLLSPTESVSSEESLFSEETRQGRKFSRKNSPYYSAMVEPSLASASAGCGETHATDETAYSVSLGLHKNTPKYVNPLIALTRKLAKTYEHRNSKFQYNPRDNPKRILTWPSRPFKNGGHDNDNNDYILSVGDILGKEKEYSYRVIDLLGQGTFGQVVKCENVDTKELVSVKVIKNKAEYLHQSNMEVSILKQLSQKISSENQHHLLSFIHSFTHMDHLCLVFELLSVNLYELIQQNSFNGLSIDLVRVITAQILDTMTLLHQIQVIHCDLKPENILLKRAHTYIQSRFYRSPEVMLGIAHTPAIDMWSLGCIVSELFTGVPLLPGSSEHNQMGRIVDMLGHLPVSMMETGKNTSRFFTKDSSSTGLHKYTMKSREQYNQEQNKNALQSRQCHPQKTLQDLILNFKGTTKPHSVMAEETQHMDLLKRQALVDFLQCTLELDPKKRWTPKEARNHAFITGDVLLGHQAKIQQEQETSHEANLIASPKTGLDTKDDTATKKGLYEKEIIPNTETDKSKDHLSLLSTGKMMNIIESLEKVATLTPTNNIPAFYELKETDTPQLKENPSAYCPQDVYCPTEVR